MDDQPTGIVEVLEDIKKKSPNFYKVLFSLPSYNSLDGHGQRKRVYRLHQQVIFFLILFYSLVRIFLRTLRRWTPSLLSLWKALKLN